jgi:hypothetical protein
MPKDVSNLDRRHRQALALRANLKRRKAQARAREEAAAPFPAEGQGPDAGDAPGAAKAAINAPPVQPRPTKPT